MKKNWIQQLPRQVVVVSLTFLAVLVLMSEAMPAFAAPPDPGYDGVSHVLLMSGGVTNYLVDEQIDALYNASPGCTQDPGTLTPPRGFFTCQASTLGTDPGGENFDHDIAAEAYPGSSAIGLAQIGNSTFPGFFSPTNPGGVPGAVSRANRVRQPTDPPVTATNGVSFAAYMKDGIQVATYGGRTQASTQSQGVSPVTNTGFSPQELVGIFETCTITQWNQIHGAAPTDTNPIVVWGESKGTGTYLTTQAYLQPFFIAAGGTGTGDPDHCASTTPNHILPAVDNAAPIDASGVANNSVSLFGFAIYTSEPAARGSASAWTIAGNKISPGNIFCDPSVGVTCPNQATVGRQPWPIQNYIFVVELSAATTANPPIPSGSPGSQIGIIGAAGGGGDTAIGQLGAARAYRDWICKLPSQHPLVDPATGLNYFLEISNAISSGGYQTVPNAKAATSVNPGTGVSDSCWYS